MEATKMRAIQFDDYGPPEVLHLADIPAPEPGPSQVQIKVAAVGVNPADFKWRQGMFKSYNPLPLPHVPGYDVAGVVSAVGPGVTRLKVGDRVAATVKGAYAEYAVAEEGACGKLPAGFDFATGAALPCAALTGVQQIEDAIKPKAGETVLVTGATGGVGRFCVHAALGLGVKVVAAVRPAYFDEARALGCEAVVSLDAGDPGGHTFDHVADTVGGPAVASLCKGLKPGGSIVTVSTTPIPPEGLAATPVFFGYTPLTAHARLEALVDDVINGKITMPVAVKMPLAEAARAQALMETGGQKGKIILEV